MYLNKAILIGNLTRDPELKALPSGAQVASFGLATNRVWKDKSGARKEDTQFHNIVMFGRSAEIAAQYLKKGNSVMIEGRIQTRTWDAADGTKKSRTEIVSERMQFGPKSSGPTGTSNPSPSVPNVAPEIEYPTEESNPEDIPF